MSSYITLANLQAMVRGFGIDPAGQTYNSLKNILAQQTGIISHITAASTNRIGDQNALIHTQRNTIIGLAGGLITALSAASYYAVNSYISSKSQPTSLLAGRATGPTPKCPNTTVTVLGDTPETLALIGKANKGLDVCTAHLRDCQSQKGQLTGQKSQLEQMLDYAKGNLTDCTAHVTQVESQRQALEIQLAGLQTGLVATLQSDLSTCVAQKTELEAQKQKIQEQLDQLSAQPVAGTSQTAQVEAEKQKLQQQLDKLSGELQASEAQKVQIEARVKDLESTIPSLQAVNDQAVENFATCMTALQECNEQPA